MNIFFCLHHHECVHVHMLLIWWHRVRRRLEACSSEWVAFYYYLLWWWHISSHCTDIQLQTGRLCEEMCAALCTAADSLSDKILIRALLGLNSFVVKCSSLVGGMHTASPQQYAFYYFIIYSGWKQGDLGPLIVNLYNAPHTHVQLIKYRQVRHYGPHAASRPPLGMY